MQYCPVPVVFSIFPPFLALKFSPKPKLTPTALLTLSQQKTRTRLVRKFCLSVTPFPQSEETESSVLLLEQFWSRNVDKNALIAQIAHH